MSRLTLYVALIGLMLLACAVITSAEEVSVAPARRHSGGGGVQAGNGAAIKKKLKPDMRTGSKDGSVLPPWDPFRIHNRWVVKSEAEQKKRQEEVDIITQREYCEQKRERARRRRAQEQLEIEQEEAERRAELAKAGSRSLMEMEAEADAAMQAEAEADAQLTTEAQSDSAAELLDAQEADADAEEEEADLAEMEADVEEEAEAEAEEQEQALIDTDSEIDQLVEEEQDMAAETDAEDEAEDESDAESDSSLAESTSTVSAPAITPNATVASALDNTETVTENGIVVTRPRRLFASRLRPTQRITYTREDLSEEKFDNSDSRAVFARRARGMEIIRFEKAHQSSGGQAVVNGVTRMPCGKEITDQHLFAPVVMENPGPTVEAANALPPRFVDDNIRAIKRLPVYPEFKPPAGGLDEYGDPIQ